MDALSALSVRLSTHRTRLIELAAQLGRPAATVEDRILELQAALVNTVDRQLEEAESEVARAKEYNEATHKRLLELQRPLSLPPSSVSKSDETILQAKLRLEEDLDAAHALQSERTALVDVKRAILRPIAALLGPESISVALDGEGAHADLSLAHIERLDAELVRCQGDLSRRVQGLQSELAATIALWQELQDPDTPAIQLDADLLDRLAPLPAGIASEHTAALRYLPCQSNLDIVIALRDKLEKEKIRRQDLIQITFDKIYPLWVKLDLENELCDQFVNAWQGVSLQSVRAYEDELIRLEAYKAEAMAVFIDKERSEIDWLCENLQLGPEDRQTFEPVLTEEASNEEILDALEQQKARLQGEATQREPILDLLRKYHGVLQDEADLIEASRDPSRLTQRGSHKRLMEEEKLRKRVAKQKPKLEQDLLSVLPDWEAEHGAIFRVDDAPLFEMLSEKMERDSASKRPKQMRGQTTSQQPLRAQATGSSNSSIAHQVRPSAQPKRSAPNMAPGTAKKVRVEARPLGSATNLQRPMLTGASNSSYGETPIRPTQTRPPPSHNHLTSLLGVQRTWPEPKLGLSAATRSDAWRPRPSTLPPID
ncbi:uncharacterized protein L969DRAFT_84773 [Mixia osmundae IAM 14324]|uniref:Microtubule associated protein n=1 Tax=Mixia osmundae (strain CBS 9802 / IAM 14324 / JCM 22182 / KY 12970) TaxID=764103 RepID=G7DTD5_MIXOS|nr:uncharacterized protein L969DRAFT_84773 [Mixia osmundae IAM 14324]KEI42881.1 hypothetical protein L969DRAFT_84773 [Mixia osmundae IAM 14324]GAA93782.1 hypothetical protein E5Q_00428 [Mixia osmundae IAM 14324]